jgi:tRNA threonylcarbamoyladenosine biosynthesis protein TsaB
VNFWLKSGNKLEPHPGSPFEAVLLALETSGRFGSVAILKSTAAGMIIDSELLERESGSAKTLAPAISRLLHRTAMQPGHLTAIAVTTGPGSFTGLRVGVATVKAMAYALRIPVVEIDTLDAIASQIDSRHASIHIVLDAYRGQLFYSEYALRESGQGHSGYEKIGSTQIVDIPVLLANVCSAETSSEARVFGGPGCDRIRKYLADVENEPQSIAWSRGVVWLDGPDSEPRAESVARLGFRKWASGELLNAFEVSPRYYRASAAEEKAVHSKQA